MKLKRSVIVLSVVASLLVLAVTLHIVDQVSHKTDSTLELKLFEAAVYDTDGNLHVLFWSGESDATLWYGMVAVNHTEGTLTWLVLEQIQFQEMQFLPPNDWIDKS